MNEYQEEPLPDQVPRFEDEQPASSTVREKKVPEVGIYQDVPEEEYLAWEAASSSRLGKLVRSPAHMRSADAYEEAETKAQAEGHAIHCAILEPDAFGSRYIVAEQCAAKIKGGERKGQQCKNAGLMLHKDFGWACGTHLKDLDTTGFATIEQKAITEGQRRMCLNVRDSVYRNPAARALLKAPGVSELSVAFDYEDVMIMPGAVNTGVRTKARWDRHVYGIQGGAILDIKKTPDAGVRAFRKKIFDYGYFRQAAIYKESAKAHNEPAKHFVFLAVESEPPYGVGVYRVLDDLVEAGRRQVTALLRLYALVMERNIRAGFPEKVQDIGLPAWAWDAIEADIDHVDAMFDHFSKAR